MEQLIRQSYPEDQRFWGGTKLFTFLGDCDIIQAISIRNIGKTYSFFEHLRMHLSKGHNIAVSRYDRIELGVCIEDFLRYYEERTEDGIVYHYKKIYNRQRETPYQCYEFENGARAYFFAVKDSPNLKGLDIQNLYRWYIDEFVPIFYKVQTRKYNEFDFFTELYHTLKRKNENLKILMSANCKNWMNPYFMGWEVPMFQSGYIMKITRAGMKIAIENVEPSKAMMAEYVKGEQLMGKSDEQIKASLKSYACDPDCFIEENRNASDTGYQIKIKGKTYGMYAKNGRSYIREEKEDLSKERYLLTPIEYDENFIFDNNFVKVIEKLLNYNMLRFDKRKTEFNIRLGVWLSHTKKV